ncbi:cytoskeleton-associated protein 2-like [Brachionichthys hirsutus]|uniref:cytoskeleton-associated protein 2-like n=1 Tax=Brachionichthys hirsutus TaxID=412623 RepID=UPI0036051E52
MEEAESVSILSRRELRKQKLVEYLAAKGRLKLPTPKPCVREECRDKEPVTSALKVLAEKENEAPAERSSLKAPAQAARSAARPAGRVFAASSNATDKSSIPTGRQKSNRQSETTGRAQPQRGGNPALKKGSAVVPSKPSLNPIGHVKNPGKPGARSSGRTSSHAASAAGTKAAFRFSSNSNAALSSSRKPDGDRIRIGPLIRTKTGLVPAVIQPRSVQRQARPSTAGADTASSAANKGRPSTSRTVSVSTLAQRKAFPVTALTDAGKQTATAGIKNQAKWNSKPLMGQPSQVPVPCKRQVAIGLRTTSKSQFTAASNKPEGRVGMSKTNKSTGLPTDESAKQKAGPVGRCSSRAVSAVVEPGRQIKTWTETGRRRELSSANAPQTAPRPSRAVSRTDTKTAKIQAGTIPQAKGKGVTAAQEERMTKLKEWRETKGISYKRPPMPVKPLVRRTLATCQPFWATMKEEDEANSLIGAVDRSLADCIKLLREGCTPDQVKVILSRLPAVSQKFVKYWICRARLMELEGNLDVLPLFEEAVSVVLEPVDELRTVVFEILKKRDEIQESDKSETEEDQIPAGESTPDRTNDPMMTPKPARTLICGEKGVSSVVKYKITATPGGPPGQQSEPARVYGKEIRFFTPVRRSVRIETASLRYPASLQDHDLCVSSYDDLISKEDEEQKGVETSPSADSSPPYLYVYRENEALKDKVFVQLVGDDDLRL